MKKVLPAGAILVPDGARKVFSGVLFDVYQWQQTMFDGSAQTFEMLRRPDTVQVLVVRDGKLLVVHDEQPGRPPRRHPPGGRADDTDASWEAAGKRELREETGLECAGWRLVHAGQPQTKIEWFVATYLVTDIIAEHEPAAEAGGERITPLWLDYQELRSDLLQGRLGSMQYMLPFFNRVKSAEELLALPAFEGREVER